MKKNKKVIKVASYKAVETEVPRGIVAALQISDSGMMEAMAFVTRFTVLMREPRLFQP